MPSLPLTLPRVSRGFAELTPAARTRGAQLADAAARALASALEWSVDIRARAVAATPQAVAGSARVAIALAGGTGPAVLEVDASLLARVLEKLSGRAPRTPAALEAAALETALLTLAALVTADAARSLGIEELDALAPAVALDDASAAEATAGGLSLMLDLRVGDDRGSGRLVVPAAAVAALGVVPELPDDAAGLALDASLRERTASLAPDELAALAPGDVVLLDEPLATAALVFPGGLSIQGRIDGAVLHVEEVRMTETQASYPITLSVEIARVRVTLGELARLEPGAALALDARKDGAVVLRAGEDVVARGHLVDVDGTLGVRIAQVGTGR